jgi:hypothetical protein
MSFKQAVQGTYHLANCYCPGLKALSRADAKKIQCDNSRRFTGSVNLDKALQGVKQYANVPRWDYGIGLNRNNGEVAIWVEVHPARLGEIDAVLKKFEWLKTWLDNDGVALKAMTRNEFFWVSSGSINFTPNSPKAKQAASQGLRGPIRQLRLTT